MADAPEKQEKQGTIDYSKSAEDVAKAKAKAHDDDLERLAKEHEANA